VTETAHTQHSPPAQPAAGATPGEVQPRAAHGTPTPPALPVVSLMGVPLSRVTMAQAVDHIARAARAGQGGWVMTPNLDILRRLVKDPSFASLTRAADVRLADGMPLIWASRLRGDPLPERVAGSDLIWHLTARAATDGLPVFLLGGNPGAGDAAARVLAERSPGLPVCGVECPPFGFESDQAYLAGLERALLAANPSIVYVALGSPKQEHLIARLRPLLPRAWFLGIGVTFSFVAGEIARAPRWMQRLGLEWVHRLAREPRRLAKRYLIDGVPFGVRLLVNAAMTRGQAEGQQPSEPPRER